MCVRKCWRWVFAYFSKGIYFSEQTSTSVQSSPSSQQTRCPFVLMYVFSHESYAGITDNCTVNSVCVCVSYVSMHVYMRDSTGLMTIVVWLHEYMCVNLCVTDLKSSDTAASKTSCSVWHVCKCVWQVYALHCRKIIRKMEFSNVTHSSLNKHQWRTSSTSKWIKARFQTVLWPIWMFRVKAMPSSSQHALLRAHGVTR